MNMQDLYKRTVKHRYRSATDSSLAMSVFSSVAIPHKIILPIRTFSLPLNISETEK